MKLVIQRVERARELYDLFVNKLKESNLDIQTGSFGDYMKIDAVLDGPVTILYSD